jgi:two-component system, cell cycle sensor histidine kinase and response regulator CckA
LFEGVPTAVEKAEAAAVAGQGELLLVVEDNDPMRAALVDVLDMLGYRVLEAADGEDALLLCRQHGTTIDLIISDWVMPRMGGLELVRKLAEQLPSVKVLLLTGHPLDEERRAEVPGNVINFLLKPPSLESLAQAVAEAIRRGRAELDQAGSDGVQG